MRGPRSFALAALAIPGSSAAASPSASLKLKGPSPSASLKLKGPSQGHSVQSPPREATSGLATCNRQHKAIVLTVEFDRAAPLLLRALTSNEKFSDFLIRFWSPPQTACCLHVWPRDSFQSMVTRQEILELAQAHASLDEPSATVIWIRRNEREAWLVEVIPTMSYDEHPERPVAFNPGRTFRHPLNLIAGNLADIERALKDEHLAAAVAEGEVLIGDALGRTLVDMAKDRVESRGRSQAG